MGLKICQYFTQLYDKMVAYFFDHPVRCMCSTFTFTAFDVFALYYYFIILLLFLVIYFCFVNVSNIRYCIQRPAIELRGFSGSLSLLLSLSIIHFNSDCEK